MIKKILTKQRHLNFSSLLTAPLVSVVALFLLLTSVGYLYAKNQELKDAVKTAGKQQEEAEATPKSFVVKQATPPEQPVPVKQGGNAVKEITAPTPAPVPVERKKVAVTFSDPTLSGTFYCYEDKVNEIANTQNSLNIAQRIFTFCTESYKSKISQCFYDCGKLYDTCSYSCSGDEISSCLANCSSQDSTCTSKCSPGGDCNDELSDIEKYRNLLIQQKNSYCP